VNEESISRAARIISESERTVVLTGAGISVPSGIPDFRSPVVGLWENIDPIEVATIDSFRLHPEKFYKFMAPLAEIMENAEPNPAHVALAEWEEMGFVHSVITQNIDNMHQRAGSKNVIELHGNGDRSRCIECKKNYSSEEVKERLRSGDGIPRCDCGAVIKPDVVLFGEPLPFKHLVQAERDSENCDLMVIVGSSLTVAPASMLPQIALVHKAKMVVANLQTTYIDSRADVVLQDKVEEALPLITEKLKQLAG